MWYPARGCRLRVGTGHLGSTRHGSAMHAGPRETTLVIPGAQSSDVRLETSREENNGCNETIKLIFLVYLSDNVNELNVFSVFGVIRGGINKSGPNSWRNLEKQEKWQIILSVCFRIPLLFLSDWPTVQKQQPIRFKSSVLPSFWQIALKTQFWLFWSEQSSNFSVQNSPKVGVNKSLSCDSLFREPRLWAVNILQTVQQGSASPRSCLPSLPWYESHAKDFAHLRQSNDWRAFPVTDNFHVWLWHVMTLMESPQMKRQEVLMEHSNNEPCLNCWCGCSVKRRPVLERDGIFITMGRGLRSNGMLAFHTSKWWYLQNLTFSAKCCTSIKKKLLLCVISYAVCLRRRSRFKIETQQAFNKIKFNYNTDEKRVMNRLNTKFVHFFLDMKCSL